MQPLTDLIGVYIAVFVSGLMCGVVLLKVSCKIKDNDKNSDCSISRNQGNKKMVLVVRNDLKMGKGKAAAQCSHAAVMAYETANQKCPDILKDWKANGQKKVVVKTECEEELINIARDAKKLGLVHAIVVDAGLTQLQPHTRTVLAVGPGAETLIDGITGHLKLY